MNGRWAQVQASASMVLLDSGCRNLRRLWDLPGDDSSSGRFNGLCCSCCRVRRIGSPNAVGSARQAIGACQRGSGRCDDSAGNVAGPGMSGPANRCARIVLRRAPSWHVGSITWRTVGIRRVRTQGIRANRPRVRREAASAGRRARCVPRGCHSHDRLDLSPGTGDAQGCCILFISPCRMNGIPTEAAKQSR